MNYGFQNQILLEITQKCNKRIIQLASKPSLLSVKRWKDFNWIKLYTFFQLLLDNFVNGLSSTVLDIRITTCHLRQRMHSLHMSDCRSSYLKWLVSQNHAIVHRKIWVLQSLKGVEEGLSTWISNRNTEALYSILRDRIGVGFVQAWSALDNLPARKSCFYPKCIFPWPIYLSTGMGLASAVLRKISRIASIVVGGFFLPCHDQNINSDEYMWRRSLAWSFNTLY